MAQYTVNFQGGGQQVVNASDPAAALENAGNPAGATVTSGGYTGGAGQPTGASQPSAPATTTGNAGAQLGAGINSLLGAIGSGNKQAFDEAVRQFNATFGLDTRKFEEAVRQFNEGLGVTQAGLTGTYQGAPTLPALTSYATQFGRWGVPQQGQQTLGAQEQYYRQGLDAINAAAALQANPFRQAEVMGQLGRLLGGQPVAGFQSPGTTDQTDFSGLGNMQKMIDDIRGGPQGTNSINANSVLNAIPTPNKVDSRSFLNMAPNQQNLVLSGIQQKYGINPDDALSQIKATMPGFQAPSTFGTIRS